MTPILIILIAFTATLIISTSFRNAFSHIQLSFQLPHFQVPHFQTLRLQFPRLSFIDAFSTFQTIPTATLKIIVPTAAAIASTTGNLYENTSSITLRAFDNFSFFILSQTPSLLAISSITFKQVVFLGTLANPMPLFFSGDILLITFINATGSLLLSLGDMLIYNLGLSILTFSHGLFFLGITVQSAIMAILTSIIRFVTVITQTIISASYFFIITCFRLSISFLSLCGTTVVTISGAVLQGIIYLSIALWGGVVFVVSAIFGALTYALNAMIHIIEIPFKILNAFWLQIKPYVDIFLRHVQMTGKDFSGGVTSFDNVVSIVNSSK